jgi:hypothetical protein
MLLSTKAPHHLVRTPWNRNTATALLLLTFCPASPQHVRHSSRNAPGWRNRAESGQRDRDLWPRGNTASETTLLSGYGVDTLRWADNVRGTPGEFQRGADPQGKGAAPGWGDIPDAAPHAGLARHA